MMSPSAILSEFLYGQVGEEFDAGAVDDPGQLVGVLVGDRRASGNWSLTLVGICPSEPGVTEMPPCSWSPRN